MKKRSCELVRVAEGVKYCVACKVLHVRRSLLDHLVEEARRKDRGSYGDHYAMALGAVVGNFLDGHPGEDQLGGVLLEGR